MKPPVPANDRPAAFFIFGGGYSAGAFARAQPAGSIVGVTTRGEEKASDFAAHGWKPFVFDGERPGDGIDGALPKATHLVISVPPGHAAPEGVSRAGGAGAAPGDPVLRWYRDEIVHGMPRLEWIGYLSTVGVYGDHDGAWIDESAPLSGQSERSRERIAAEEAWGEAAREAGVPLAILRLPGIYGPGRSAFDKLESGKARRTVKPGQVFNRVHVDDIAGAIAHLAVRRIGGAFNVTDDEPAPPQDVIEHAARLAGLPVPPDEPFDPVAMSPMARSFWSENKRVSNAALKATGYALRYPTYREGLAAITPRSGR
ncbi:SDR family oxidoreductase [Aureimonas mangrovi]|uniref:SDR family oxidoreductase n=1 Tax=Aureimonas mangrovi TaxID=2758041 RepID=UPI00163DE2F8|nr:SDR family oxidoreductase [Aureimonas mangrovi]